MKTFFLTVFLLIALVMTAQPSQTKSLPYHEIPDFPGSYTAGNVISRMIDGLGYRFYWATEGLTNKDLTYRPSEDSRSTFETLQHIYGLVQTIAKTSEKVPSIRPYETPGLSFVALRAHVLEKLQSASLFFRDRTDSEISELSIVFKKGEQRIEFPFWNLINGQIADALYHTGQVVSYRRITGNPIAPGVNVFTGKTRE